MISNKLTVWLLQTGEPLHMDPDPRPMRAMNLANALVEAGHTVVLWSSAFYHQEKRHRTRGAQTVAISPQLEIRLVPSPGYSRNIGPGRLWDHAVLGYQLRRLLKKETTPPDVAFIGYPPIEAAAVMTRWLSSRGVPCLLDVKDQWPTIFVNAVPAFLAPIVKVALFPYFRLGRRAMREATGLTAMAEGFLQWALIFSGRLRSRADRVIPLTTPNVPAPALDRQKARDWWDGQGVMADGRARVCFIGSHSRAFDMNPVAEAAKSFAAKGQHCQFVICGDGECSAAWKDLLRGLPNVVFAGWVNRPQIQALAERSTVALAPYHSTDDFAMSVPNKIIDSLALGLPIASSLGGEVEVLIASNGVGLSYGPASGTSLAQCLERMLQDPEFTRQSADRALRLYSEKFSFSSVYGGAVGHLEMLAARGCSEARYG